MKSVDKLKNGWFIKDAKNGTSAVSGSPSHHRAPTATQTEATKSNTRHLIAEGCALEIISVNLRSKAFKSSHATCSRDIAKFKVGNNSK